MIRDNRAYSVNGISAIIVHRHLRTVEEDAQPIAMIDK